MDWENEKMIKPWKRIFTKFWMTGFFMASNSFAADFYVSQSEGSDVGSGSKTSPFRSILHAVKAAGAGDTVHLLPGNEPWRESVRLYTHPKWYHPGGEPGNPLVIDGHGAWITGADPCPPEDWTQEADGVWSHHGMVYTPFLVIDGELQRQLDDLQAAEPGELVYQEKANRLWFHSRPGQPMPTVEIGQPDGTRLIIDPKDWQYAGIPGMVRYCGTTPPKEEIQEPTSVKIAGEERRLVRARERLSPGQFTVVDSVLYFNPPEGKRPDEMNLEAVIRENGVSFGGQISHVVIRNLNIRHVANDGYNIHGKCKDLAFYNCNAEDCGDEGFSSHDDCETLLDGAVYRGCDNGIMNVNRAKSITRNVIIANSRSVGYGGQQESQHYVENLILLDNPNQLTSPTLSGRNILILNTVGGAARTAVSLGGVCHLKQLTVLGDYPDHLLKLYGVEKATLIGSRFENAGILHIRSDDLSILDVVDSIVSPDTLIEWGNQQPFKRSLIADADKDPRLPFAGFQLIERPLLQNLIRGTRPESIPKDSGCTPELIERYLEYMKEASL